MQFLIYGQTIINTQENKFNNSENAQKQESTSCYALQTESPM